MNPRTLSRRLQALRVRAACSATALAFASTAPPPPTFLLWALLYPLVLLAATIWTFARRDL